MFEILFCRDENDSSKLKHQFFCCRVELGACSVYSKLRNENDMASDQYYVPLILRIKRMDLLGKEYDSKDLEFEEKVEAKYLKLVNVPS